MATMINRIVNMTVAHLSHKQRTSFMNMDHVPKSTWKRIMMQLCFVVIILIVCSPYPSTASHDPWGENLQPKLHTDYLNEYSGKNEKYYIENDQNWHKNVFFIYK